jgi:hypothetical protein
MTEKYERYINDVKTVLLVEKVKIIEEIHNETNDDFCFKFIIGEFTYDLDVEDGFALYQLDKYGHRSPIWIPLENDFVGLKRVLDYLKNN